MMLAPGSSFVKASDGDAMLPVVAFTLIQLDRGVLSLQVEGAIEQGALQRLIAPAVWWLKCRGGGTFVVPHTPASGDYSL